MSPQITTSSTTDSLTDLRLRMIRELEWFLSAGVTKSTGRLIPNRTHGPQTSARYDKRVVARAGETKPC